jgi:hypothetical protein
MATEMNEEKKRAYSSDKTPFEFAEMISAFKAAGDLSLPK